MSQYSIKLIFLILLGFSCGDTQAKSARFDNTDIAVEVSGSGSVTVIPDNFSLSLSISERGNITSKLKVLVDKKSDLVMQAAKNLGVKSTDISSAQVNLRIIKENPPSRVQGVEFTQNNKNTAFINGQDIAKQGQQGKHKNTLFELSRRIQVSFTNIDDYDQFLTQLVKINVSHISALSMNVTQRDKHYQQALLHAITQAKQKA